MKRALALLLALAMVGGAFLIRNGGGGDDAGPDDGPDTDPSDEVQVVCADPICQALGRVTAPGSTADAILAGDATDLVWIVPELWVDLVIADAALRGEPVDVGDVEALAQTNAAIASFTGAVDCAEVDWACLADHSGRDRFTAAVTAVDSPGGLLAAVAVTADLLDRVDFASNDFATELRNRINRLATADDPLLAMRREGPGRYGAASATTAQTGGSLSSTFGTIVAAGSTPVVGTRLVAVAIGDASLRDVDLDAVREAARAQGWDAAGPEALPAPRGEVLVALRDLWKD